MTLNIESTGKNCEPVVTDALERTRSADESGARATADGPKRLRRLKWNEVVSVGDFVADEHEGFKPWAGPRGFQANSFLIPVYRATKARRPQLKKCIY